jgi:hypothetical protein
MTFDPFPGIAEPQQRLQTLLNQLSGKSHQPNRHVPARYLIHSLVTRARNSSGAYERKGSRTHNACSTGSATGRTPSSAYETSLTMAQVRCGIERN